MKNYIDTYVLLQKFTWKNYVCEAIGENALCQSNVRVL